MHLWKKSHVQNMRGADMIKYLGCGIYRDV